MKFYCIIRSRTDIQNPDTYNLLKKAVTVRGLEFVDLETNVIDYDRLDEIVETNSLLYRIAGGGRSSLLEVLLSDRTTTLKHDISAILSRGSSWGSAIRMKQVGLPVIPTIFNVSRTHTARMGAYVEKLGGFPVILKSAGGSHGSGVMKFDTLESLQAVLDYISDDKTRDLVLRRFIANAQHLRLVVVGDQVVDTIRYRPQEDDFRTNAVAVPQVDPVTDVSEKILADAVRAVHCQGLEFGGVDILVDEVSDHFIAEVNFPCNFARNQLNTGTDIAGHIVDYLVKKHEKEQVV